MRVARRAESAFGQKEKGAQSYCYIEQTQPYPKPGREHSPGTNDVRVEKPVKGLDKTNRVKRRLCNRVSQIDLAFLHLLPFLELRAVPSLFLRTPLV